MNPMHMRHFWSLVEASQATQLLQLDDHNLFAWLMDQLQLEQPLDRSEMISIGSYVQTKLPLVRDMAQARLVDF